jgi:hypothetical protein
LKITFHNKHRTLKDSRRFVIYHTSKVASLNRGVCVCVCKNIKYRRCKLTGGLPDVDTPQIHAKTITHLGLLSLFSILQPSLKVSSTVAFYDHFHWFKIDGSSFGWTPVLCCFFLISHRHQGPTVGPRGPPNRPRKNGP